MNNLYTQDKLARNNDDFGGSGVGSGHYTPQEEFKEKLEETKLPLILLAFSVLCLCILIYLSYSEYDLYHNGKSVEATVNSDGKTGTYYDESGISHVVDISWAGGKNNNGTVTIYYKNFDYVHAQPITAWWIYLIAYLFFWGIFVLIVFWIYKLLHKTKHSEKSGSIPAGYRSKFDE